MTALDALSLLSVVLADVGIVYLAFAAIAVRRIARRDEPGADSTRPDASWPSVTVLKPLHGLEPGLAENLESFLRQDYPGPVQLVFGVQREGDPAIGVVRRLQQAYPERDLGLVVDARLFGSNRKVSNLINMSASIAGDVVVLADSDIRVRPDYLRRLVAVLDRPGVGAVTCLYGGLPGGNAWSRLATLSIGTHFLPGAAVGVASRLASPCMGSTIALRRSVLERIGGFRGLADELADDYALGAAVRRLDLGVPVASFAVEHVCPERSWRELAGQELRWQRTVRRIDPVGHAASLVTHPFAFALAAFALAPGYVTLGLAVGALAARAMLCLAVERAFGLHRHPYRLIPVRDILSFVLFAASFLGRGVSWRGHQFEVARTGALLPKAMRPDAT